MLRVDIESTSSSPFHAFHDVRRFSTTFGRRLTGRGGIDQNQRLQKLLISLYALFFYLSWFQKKQKLPTTSWVMNKSETLASAPGPAPRPKPSTLQSWKPKVPSPPQSPESERKTAGMSASDAMESIGKGGSLKERMAALQGKDKPRWKPPPPLSPPADEVVSQDGVIDPQGSSPPATGDPDHTDLEGGHEAQQDAAEIEQDPEEEERQRRAAIAARMARLGGARVGMGPPLFAAKPAPKKPATPPPQPKQDEEVALPDSEVTSPPADLKDEAQTDPDYFPALHKDSESSSLSLTDSPSNATTRSMPVPAGPRRAAPPRKKASFSGCPDVEPTEEPAIEPTTEPETELEPESVLTVTSQESVESPEQVQASSAEQILSIGEVGVSIELNTAEADSADKLEDEDHRVDADEPVPEQQDQEEEEQEYEEQEHEEREQRRRRRRRRRRITWARLNPLTRPPPVPRRDSIPSPTVKGDSIITQLEDLSTSKQAKEAREVDEPASGAAEFDDGSQPHLGATRRVLYHDEKDEEERFDGSNRLLNESEAWEPAITPTHF
ncbi:hypothetical protein BD769DRAFT_1733227 [Suillus cothurnatus]|nr:hypothetical protein BD769DRAFT_1733227 [Suillus cothurnatus]